MSNEHGKRCSILYVIREMQTTATTWFHHTPSRRTKKQNYNNIYWQGWETTGILRHCLWEYKMVQPLWKTFSNFFAKPNIFLPHDPVIIFFGIYLKRLRPCVHTKACAQILIAALFIIVKTWKQWRCPFSSGMDKLWYIWMIKYYSGLGKKKRSIKPWNNMEET